jgi:hypothetical protein
MGEDAPIFTVVVTKPVTAITAWSLGGFILH